MCLFGRKPAGSVCLPVSGSLGGVTCSCDGSWRGGQVVCWRVGLVCDDSDYRPHVYQK